MRTLSAGLIAHLASNAHSRAWMLRLDLADGTIIGFTSHDKDLLFDMGIDDAGVINFRHDLGLTLTNIDLACGLEASTYEIRGPLSVTITRAGVQGGRFDDADAWLFQVNWKSLADGMIHFQRGFVSDLKTDGGQFVCEISDQRGRYRQQIGRVITPQCWKEFASPECGATATEIVGTVTAATDALHIILSFAGSYADNFFNKGRLIGLTGENVGVTVEIEAWHGTGAVELFAPFPVLPAVGDTYTVRDGCSKIRMSADPAVPTCLTHNNVINMGGYAEVPGQDQIWRTALPGEGDQ